MGDRQRAPQLPNEAFLQNVQAFIVPYFFMGRRSFRRRLRHWTRLDPTIIPLSVLHHRMILHDLVGSTTRDVPLLAVHLPVPSCHELPQQASGPRQSPGGVPDLEVKALGWLPTVRKKTQTH